MEITKEKIVYKGAEATLFMGYWFGRKVILKYRFPKEYRLEDLDRRIRTERTLNEGKALIKVKSYGLNVPQIYEIDAQNSILIMKYIEGKKLKDTLGKLDQQTKEKYFRDIGRFIAILHKNGHIHGDITTSNLIITDSEEIFLIDFGLHEYSDTIEDKSVDLHLFKRVLISSHGDDFEFCFSSFLDGYRSEYETSNITECNQIINNIKTIESRGRYVKPEDR